MSCIILFCSMDWRQQDDPFLDRRMLPFLTSIVEQLPGIRLGAVDWRMMTPGPMFRIFDVELRVMRDMKAADVRFIHVYRLGGRAGSDQYTLTGKWADVAQVISNLEAEGVRLVNSGRAIRKGLSKRYLLDLAAKGLPIVPSEFVPADTPIDLIRAMTAERLSIVKPANGECGRMVHMAHTITADQLGRMATQSPELVIQPCMSEILAGEKSLVFLGRRFSHAVRKIPRLPDLRTNAATIVPYWPSTAEQELAHATAAAFDPALDCFRIDLVGDLPGLHIMEFEVVDAGHYCPLGPAYAARLADFYRGLLGLETGLRASVE